MASVARSMLIGIALAVSAAGQTPPDVYSQLATNFDGSALYFVSPLKIRGSDQYPHEKIFRWTEPDGVRLHKQVSPAIRRQSSGIISDHYFRLAHPFVSGDESTVVFEGLRDCNWGSPCIYDIQRYQTYIHFQGRSELELAGRVESVSRNGRYILLWLPMIGGGNVRLLDLQTGEETPIVGYTPSGFRYNAIADNGTVVLPSGVRLWRNGQAVALVGPGVGVDGPCMIDASASRIVYRHFGPQTGYR